MACAKCAFYRPKGSARALFIEGKTGLLRLKQDIPLTEAEVAAVDDGVTAFDTLLTQLADVPTPAGPTPRQLEENAATELLEQQRAMTENLQRQLKVVCPRVFHRAGWPIKSFRVAFRSACKDAGCPGRVLHDFRRTAVRNLVRAGIPERVAMQMTGHKTRSVFERYNIVSVGDLREAARRLDIATGTISGTIEEKPQVLVRQ